MAARLAALQLVAAVVGGLGGGDRSSAAIQADALKAAARVFKESRDSDACLAVAGVCGGSTHPTHKMIVARCPSAFSRLPECLAMSTAAEAWTLREAAAGGGLRGWRELEYIPRSAPAEVISSMVAHSRTLNTEEYG